MTSDSRSATRWPRAPRTGSTAWASSSSLGLPERLPRPPVPPRAAQRPAMAPHLQPDRQAERATRRGTGGHLFRWEFDAAAKRFPDYVIDYYVGILSNP